MHTKALEKPADPVYKHVGIDKPSDIKTERFRNQLIKFFEAGAKPSEIRLIINFASSEKTRRELAAQFQLLKNRVLFKHQGVCMRCGRTTNS